MAIIKNVKILLITFWVVVCFFLCKVSFSQEAVMSEKKSFGDKVLNAFWDKDISRWSVRALANFKDNRFRLRNDDFTLEYRPNNPSGVGFGIANSKLIVDIIFNLKTDKEEITDRLDIQGDFMIGRSYVLFQFQDYQGFNVKNISIEDPGMFRRDIRTRTINLSYFYIFNSSVNVLHSIFSGVNENYRSAGTFLGGIYTNLHRIEADSSIVPESSSELFNEEAQIVELEQYGIGINFGYSYLFALPSDFLIYLSAAPGIGIGIKYIDTETFSYKASDIWQGYITANIQIGYNGRRIYALISAVNTWFYSSIDTNNKGSINSTKFKLILGWKFHKHD